MKKPMTVFVAMVLAVSFSAATWAGERSNLLSEKELLAIQSTAEKAYPRGTKVFMVVGEDFLERFTVIEFIKEDHTASLQLEVRSHYAKISHAESDKVGERVGVKVIEAIEKILNKKPRAALGRNLLERQRVSD